MNSVVRPIAEPRLLEGVYTEDQHCRLLDVVKKNGPWALIIAQHFGSPEELVATISGAVPGEEKPSFDMFLSPVFRGYFAKNGTCLHPEIEDCFYNRKFLDQVRSYWKADYAKPENMLFNIQGPAHCGDPAHLDATEFRGINMLNTPIWLMNTMTKSGLFGAWLMKKAQVIAWFYKGKIGGGFTYWPNGPKQQPKRLAAPMWNRGVVVQNEMMYHRAESNGPVDRRKPAGLAFDSRIEADPDSSDDWRIVTRNKIVEKISADEMRFLVHWGAAIYSDYEELKLVMDHRDDLTHDRVFEMIVADLKSRGEVFQIPSDPLRDPEFIMLLTRLYDPGAPSFYPAEAPGPALEMAA